MNNHQYAVSCHNVNGEAPTVQGDWIEAGKCYSNLCFSIRSRALYAAAG